MFVLIRYNKNSSELSQKAKKEGLTPVICFDLILSKKEKTREDLKSLIEVKNNLNIEYSAVRVYLEKIDNSTIGMINNLKNQFDLVIGYGGLNKMNRFFLEQCNIDILQDPQNSSFASKIDFVHHFNSGLNQILCKMAKEAEVIFFFSLNFTINKRQVLREFGRINQNIGFARKYKIPVICSFLIEDKFQLRSAVEISAIMGLFDVSTHQVKESLQILERRCKDNTFKKSSSYISRGIEVIE